MKRNYLTFTPLLFILICITACNNSTDSAVAGNKQNIAVASSQIDPQKVEEIDKLISKYAEYGKFNGSILVSSRGEVIYKQGFGLANMEWEIPNASDTKHRLASITKQFTAMLIVQLAAENKLDLDKPISRYLPNYPSKNGDQITIHHLLTHSSGTPNFTSFPGYREQMSKFFMQEDIVALFADLPLEFTPGERFNYSNSGYVLLGAIIEKVSGKPYEQVLKDKIFIPLKMNNSGYDHNTTVLKNRATGYSKGLGSFQHARYLDMSLPFAAGAIYSTVEDLHRWDQALYSEKLLPKEYRDLLFETHIPDGGSHYGYGWVIGEMPIGNSPEESATIGHSGGINGFNTLITRFPADSSMVVLLNNTGGAPLKEMTIAINGILNDKAYDSPKQSIAHLVLAMIHKEGMSEALARYELLKDSTNYSLDESEMNMLGYELMNADKMEDALVIFKLNVDAFPNAFNVYDSYGEALLSSGEESKGIENYIRSIQLNPKNNNARRVLKGLGVDPEDMLIKEPLSYLKLLVGEYITAANRQGTNDEWKIVFTEENGVLYGDDAGYRYTIVPVGEGKFVNPDDGAILEFDTSDKASISMVLFGRFTFKKQ